MLKIFRFSSEEAIDDDYLNSVENDIDESEMSEKHLSNESVNEEPMIYIDLVTMLPMPPNRRQGKLERRQSVSNPISLKLQSGKYLYFCLIYLDYIALKPSLMCFRYQTISIFFKGKIDTINNKLSTKYCYLKAPLG